VASAEFHEELKVDADKLFQVVVDYPSYAQFLDGCTGVEVHSKEPGKARATYHVSMMKEVSYTVDHVEDSQAGTMNWTLVKSDAMTKNSGSWKITPRGPGKCDVLYKVEIEFKIPVPGFILNRLIKGSLPAMIKSFEERARKG